MLKINKFTVLGIIATIILVFLAGVTGIFEHYFYMIGDFLTYHVSHTINSLTFHMHSMVLMLGICLGILSTFAKRKRKTLFYSSILTIILGQIILGIIALMNAEFSIEFMKDVTNIPDPVFTGVIRSYAELVTREGSIFHPEIFWHVLSNNLFVAFRAILMGPTIILPYIYLGTITSQLVNITGAIWLYGFRGVILWIGAFHAYPELYAAYLALISGIRISLKSFKAYISIRRNGFKSTLKTIGRVMIHELRSTAPKVVILLVIAALLQASWYQFWIIYWAKHIL